MTNVILQPESGVEPRKHYIDTVINSVAFSRLASYISIGELAALKIVTQSDTICAWGIVPSGKSKWSGGVKNAPKKGSRDSQVQQFTESTLDHLINTGVNIR